MPLRLQISVDSRLPIDFASFDFELLRRQSLIDIERRLVNCGNAQSPLAELFNVSGDPADGEIDLAGDLTSVHGIGTGLTQGSIRIDGNAGRHLGAQMLGGRIEVFGNAGDWLGAEMHGGRIRVHGNAADHAAAAYPGSLRGMTGGELLIDGDAGNHLGTAMRRGLVAVGETAGDGVGTRMLAGTILIGGRSGRHTGAGMRRGTIALLSSADDTDALSPTFARANRWSPQFMRMLAVYLHRGGFPKAEAWIDAEYVVYHGDQLASADGRGKGEILVRA